MLSRTVTFEQELTQIFSKKKPVRLKLAIVTLRAVMFTIASYGLEKKKKGSKVASMMVLLLFSPTSDIDLFIIMVSLYTPASTRIVCPSNVSLAFIAS
jgi:hypothetical protein